MTVTMAPRHLLTLVLGLAVMLVTAGCDVEELVLERLNVNASVNVDMSDPDASETVTSDIPFSGQRVVVDNPIGHIAIETVDDPGYVAVRPMLHIEATKNVKGMDLADLQIQTTRTPEETRIRVTTTIESARNEADPNGSRGDEERIGWVDFKIRLPEAALVTLRQNAGSIVVSNFRGELTAATDLGEIEVRNAAAAEMNLRTELGSLSVADSTIDGDLIMESTAGEAKLTNVQFGQAEIDTQAGDVDVKGARGQSLEVVTQMGEIDVVDADVARLDLSSQMGEIGLHDSRVTQGDLRTQWGEINVRLPSGAVPRIRASTQAGGVDVFRLPISLRSALQQRGSWLGEGIELTPAGAQATLDLKTQLGDIRIVFPESRSL